MHQKVKLNNRGQVFVEYVLVLIVSVSLILALSTMIFKPFQKFVQSIMGDYVACLLETGELPTLGADNGAQENECRKKFSSATADFKNQASSSAAQYANEAEKSQQERADAAQASNRGGPSRSGSSRGDFLNKGSHRNGDVGRENSSKKVTLDLAESGGPSFFSGSSRNSIVIIRKKKRTSVGNQYQESETIKKIQSQRQKLGPRVMASEEMSPPKKKVLIQKQIAPTKISEDEPMTFGNFLRILFIAAIIIALVLLIGGQMLQMSKSD